MKKFVLKKIILPCLCAAVLPLCSCAKKVNYFDYVSELRENIYLYEDDVTTIKIYCGERESPYNSDGIKGEMGAFCEVYVYLPAQNGDVNITAGGISGEMSYLTVKGCYYLSGSVSTPESDYIEVELNGENYKAESVLYDGVISAEQAVAYAAEYRSELFASMTANRLFNGEIYVRLLYDDACYYFVGACDLSGSLTCWLIDGATGKIIAEKTD